MSRCAEAFNARIASTSKSRLIVVRALDV